MQKKNKLLKFKPHTTFYIAFYLLTDSLYHSSKAFISLTT